MYNIPSIQMLRIVEQACAIKYAESNVSLYELVSDLDLPRVLKDLLMNLSSGTPPVQSSVEEQYISTEQLKDYLKDKDK